MSRPPRPPGAARWRRDRIALIAALGIAAAAAAASGWLWLSGGWPDPLSETPRVEIELNEVAASVAPPAEPAPAVSGETTPVEPPAPGEPPAPTETAMAEPAPPETAPTETAVTAPPETAPMETAPTETAPTETAPAETAPAETAVAATTSTETTMTAPTETTAPPPAAPAVSEPTAPAETAMTAPSPAPAVPVVAAPGGEPAAEALPVWRRFARPFPADETRPRIAVVVTGLGLSATTTDAAIRGLPGEVTLAFSPYGSRLAESVALARTAGHEVMLELPMEPASYPRDDPGPQGLLTSLAPAQNRARLEWVLKRAEGNVGVAAYMGSRFTASAEHMRPVLSALAERELMFLDGTAPGSVAGKLAEEIGVPVATTTLRLDDDASPAAIDGRLQQIEREARTAGAAVAMVAPSPAALERLGEWARTLPGKGLVLAPISALARPGPAP